MKKLLIVAALLLLTIPGVAQEALVGRVKEKATRVQHLIPAYVQSGGSAQEMVELGKRVKALGQSGKLREADALLDKMLVLMEKHGATPPPTKWDEVLVQGDNPANGIYDLSLEYDSQGVGWMAYSAVWGLRGKNQVVETHLARSTDRGQTWTYVTDLNKAKPATLDGEKGVWWNEVPTLVYDPDDNGREWKLYYHKYFAKMPYQGSKDRRLQYGWIAYKTAPRPEGPWSKEEALFGAGQFPQKPYRTRINVSSLHPNLSSYFVLTELGSLYHNEQLYLSMQAIRMENKKPQFDLVLLTSKDHGRSWQYVGTPLKAEEARRYGGDGWTGSSLAKEKGRVFLLICPERNNDPQTGHLGTLVFEFTDIDKGKLNMTPTLRVKPSLAKGGQSDYDERNSNGGIIFPQTEIRNLPRMFRLYRTERRLVRGR